MKKGIWLCISWRKHMGWQKWNTLSSGSLRWKQDRFRFMMTIWWQTISSSNFLLKQIRFKWLGPSKWQRQTIPLSTSQKIRIVCACFTSETPNCFVLPKPIKNWDWPTSRLKGSPKRGLRWLWSNRSLPSEVWCSWTNTPKSVKAWFQQISLACLFGMWS